MDCKTFIILCLSIICILFSGTNKAYVALQGLDQVGIVDFTSGEIDIVEIDYVAMSDNTPHFIVIDEINRYWFVTTISSGYVGRYNLDTNELIDKILVDDSPALMVLNEEDKKLYVSRMMPMVMMTGDVSTIIHEIDYSDSEDMFSSNEFEVSSPAPHGLAINQEGSEIYVTSNTADWFYKIIPETEEIVGVVMDKNSPNVEYPNNEVDRLKPIQCVSLNDNLLVITCSAGIAFDSFTGTNDTIPGQVQLWNTSTMTLIDTVQFSWQSNPWHVINSPINNEVFIALAGDQLYSGTSGVVSLFYDSNSISVNWKTDSPNFNTLHGIDISNDGQILFVSGRIDGHLHILDANDGTLIESAPLAAAPSTVLAGGVAVLTIIDLVLDDNIILPQNITLYNYPNPFNARTTISFANPKIQDVTVEIIDLRGRALESYFYQYLHHGRHSIVWNAESYPSGQYIIQMKSGDYRKISKIILLK